MSNIVHDILAQQVFVPCAEAAQHILPSRREYQVNKVQAMRFLTSTCGWTGGEKRDWILRQLRLAVRRAYGVSPYYRALFDHIGFDVRTNFGFADFAKIPVLEKKDIFAAKRDMISTALPSSRLRRDATGGSTGQPVEIWLGPEESAWRYATENYARSQIGVRPGAPLALLWGHHLDPVTSDKLKDRLVSFIVNLKWYDCFRLSAEKLDKYHHEFQQRRPECIIAYAKALSDLADHVLANGYHPAYPTRCFVTGAEKLQNESRCRIEQAFGRPVHEQYGSRDVGLMAFQYQPRRATIFGVNWRNTIIEPLNSDRESEVLVTKLHADGMPMIRYRIGDLALFPKGSAPGTSCP